MALAIISLHYVIENQSKRLRGRKMENFILQVTEILVALPIQKMSEEQCLNLGEANYCGILRQS